MKVLVTGAGGQLGYDVRQDLIRRRVEHLCPASGEMDITDAGAVRETVRAYHPDAVIHCAAYTRVDRAEEEPEKCWAVNADGTRNVALACREAGAKLLYVSTDYVFPGDGERPYVPEDAAGPRSVYGASKLAGELAVRELLERYFIVRTSWAFGSHGGNFVKTMLRLAESRDTVNVVCDQVGSPTYTADLAPLLREMVTTEKYGTYHATNEGYCSWAEFAQAIFKTAGKPVRVEPVATERYPAKALRPKNSRLSKDKLEAAGFSRLPAWQDALARYMKRTVSAERAER